MCSGFDMDTTPLRYDNRMGNAESDGDMTTLRYERNKISAGYDHAFTFRNMKSYLNWNGQKIKVVSSYAVC